ncbi:MAG: hypothetical protein AB8B69_18495 [Chitinophagales bacterium]
MRKLSAILFLLVIHSSLLACCSTGIINVFPYNDKINSNTLIMIEGTSKFQKVVNELSYLYPIYLESGTQKVNLIAIENCYGDKISTQVLLRPEEGLKVGYRYELKVEKLDAEAQRYFYRIENEVHNPYSWIVEEENLEKPTWNLLPKFRGEFRPTMFPQAAYALFELDVSNGFSVLIKTELIDITTQKSLTYYLEEYNELKVGYGDCQGPFDFEENHQYKVRFDILASNGQTSGTWTDWYEFESPHNR